MSGHPPRSDQAEVKPRRFFWVWLIPVASVGIGGYLLWSSLSSKGPLIQITFATAEGLQAGQSQVKFKDIQMGTVESFDLSADRSRVDMNVRMTRKAESLLTEGTQFWVVKPRFFAGEISGLSTVISGSYLAIQPGAPDKPAKRRFEGLEQPPGLEAGMRGRQFELTATRIGGINVGSPVFFHDVEVGKVTDWKPVGVAQSVALTVFVQAPYDLWVHDDSRFWNTSGIGLKMSAEGVQLQVNSMKAALLGGVSFDTPSPEKPDAESQEGHKFELYSNEEIATSATSPNRKLFASYFSGSIGGLAVGAPVKLQGAPIGNVTSVNLQFDTDTNRARVRAAFTLQLDKVSVVGSAKPPPTNDRFRALVKQGLRTRLQGGNLLTGQKEIEMEIEDDAEPAATSEEGDVLVLPSQNSGGGIDALTTAAQKLLAKVNRLPFQEIGDNLNQTLQGAGAIINGKQLKQALLRLTGTLTAAQDAVTHFDAGMTPALRRLPDIASELQGTLAQVRGLTASIAEGSAGNAKFGRDLDKVLAQVADAAQSVRAVADLLARHPEALVRGRLARASE